MTSALDNVIGKVVDESRQELISVLESAFAEGEKILEESEQEARSEAKKVLQTADRLAESRARQILGSAEIEGRNKILRLVEGKINEVFKKSIEDLRMKKSNNYAVSLRRMIVDGLDSIQAERFVVRCNKEDKKMVIKISEEISRERKTAIIVSDQSLQSSGGVEVENEDSTISVRNTFEDRLERLKPELRRELANTFLR